MELRRDIVPPSLAGIFTLLGFILFRFLGVTAENVVVKPLQMQQLLADQAVPLSAALTEIVSTTVLFSLPLFSLTIAMAVVAAYSTRNDVGYGTVVGVCIGGVVGLLFTGLSFTSAAAVAGAVTGSFFIPGIARNTYQTSREDREYAAATRSAGRGLIIMNVFLALGLFLSIFTSFPVYRDSYLNQLREPAEISEPGELTDQQVIERMPNTIRNKFEDLSAEKRDRFLEEYREVLSGEMTRRTDSGLEQVVGTYLYAVPLLAFGALELLRSVVLVRLAGLTGGPLMRRQEEYMDERI